MVLRSFAFDSRTILIALLLCVITGCDGETTRSDAAPGLGGARPESLETTSSTGDTAGARPPNVVVVVADDLGVDLVGAYARFFPPTPPPNRPVTPVIDRLASQGLLFRNAWTNPGCSPSRTQILTGLHARRTGIGGITKRGDRATPPERPGLDFGYTLLPQILKTAPVPYDTAAVGKWHLASPNQGVLHPLGPSGRWFDRWAGSLFNIGGRDRGYRRWRKFYATPIDSTGGTDACGPPYPCVKVVGEAESCDRYATVDTTNDAVHLVRSMSKPFFLYVAYNAPHPPPELPGCALPGSSREGPLEPFTGTLTPPQQFRAMVRTLDHQFGRLLDAIDETDTVVIFIGDNGSVGNARDGTWRGIVPPFIGDHGKTTLYQGGLNVPLIVRGPGVESGVTDALVNSTDIFATVAELAGYADPNSLAQDSISWVPYHQNPERPSLRSTVHAERFTPTYTPVDRTTGEPPRGYRAERHHRAIRNYRFKLIERHFAGRPPEEELYDLLEGGEAGSDGAPARDDFEQNDLMLNRAAWPAGGVVEKNYRALKLELERVLPALP